MIRYSSWIAVVVFGMVPLATAADPKDSPAEHQARLQNQNINNLEVIAQAFMRYSDDHKSAFPPAVSRNYIKNGPQTSKFPHSWRIDVLPYIGDADETQLFNQYHFDEPWDSEANKKVLEQIPEDFRSPFDSPRSTNTSYFALTGPDTIFSDEQGVSLRDIIDGTSSTILLVEAKQAVPWTKPEDIPYARDKPLPKLGGWLPDVFLACMADCSVRKLPTNIDEVVLRAYITKAGREKDRSVVPGATN